MLAKISFTKPEEFMHAVAEFTRLSLLCDGARNHAVLPRASFRDDGVRCVVLV